MPDPKETPVNLNIAATAELGRLVGESTELLPAWKAAMSKLLENGIPKNLALLQELISEEPNDKTKTAQG